MPPSKQTWTKPDQNPTAPATEHRTKHAWCTMNFCSTGLAWIGIMKRWASLSPCFLAAITNSVPIVDNDIVTNAQSNNDGSKYQLAMSKAIWNTISGMVTDDNELCKEGQMYRYCAQPSYAFLAWLTSWITSEQKQRKGRRVQVHSVSCKWIWHERSRRRVSNLGRISQKFISFKV